MLELLLIMSSFLMLYERGLISENSIAIVAESHSLFFPFFLLSDHVVKSFRVYTEKGMYNSLRYLRAIFAAQTGPGLVKMPSMRWCGNAHGMVAWH